MSTRAFAFFISTKPIKVFDSCVTDSRYSTFTNTEFKAEIELTEVDVHIGTSNPAILAISLRYK
jgi:hypothetical protein